jgi:hypothetical protein
MYRALTASVNVCSVHTCNRPLKRGPRLDLDLLGLYLDILRLRVLGPPGQFVLAVKASNSFESEVPRTMKYRLLYLQLCLLVAQLELVAQE